MVCDCQWGPRIWTPVVYPRLQMEFKYAIYAYSITSGRTGCLLTCSTPDFKWKLNMQSMFILSLQEALAAIWQTSLQTSSGTQICNLCLFYRFRKNWPPSDMLHSRLQVELKYAIYAYSIASGGTYASFLQVRLGKKYCVLYPVATIRVQNRLRCLLGDGVFFTLQPLSHRRKVDSYPVSSNLYT